MTARMRGRRAHLAAVGLAGAAELDLHILALRKRHKEQHRQARRAKRLELLLRMVLAFPKASSSGLDCRMTFLTF